MTLYIAWFWVYYCQFLILQKRRIRLLLNGSLMYLSAQCTCLTALKRTVQCDALQHRSQYSSSYPICTGRVRFIGNLTNKLMQKRSSKNVRPDRIKQTHYWCMCIKRQARPLANAVLLQIQHRKLAKRSFKNTVNFRQQLCQLYAFWITLLHPENKPHSTCRVLCNSQGLLTNLSILT